ncbi:hypothetical protein C3747_10g112 [Trypanosoma cruzi]|uniref:Uncharacterized protein n=1 Tax=Trypanosoma cruzi TaxID=5693 RepID=A0A2V2XEL5_TRYCR|nr:hypothetical protein ECC02_006283 [Trypanosoma cruzi]KAF8276011.1 putative protein of unknown function (DUF4586) [Trypanosoma cruzi]PWV19326.1 hypothetical protein C3747_10g112 [Trypanosoma cruzi]RNC35667.1 hypothetical protein TcCL_Unassigned01440 [Trypanosoma cruzi]
MVFSIPSFLGLGDRYKHAVDERAQGVNFVTCYPKTGHNPDALFDKEFKYMYNGDRRSDPETMARREQMEKRKKDMTATGFAYVGPPQKGEGLGSYYGLIQREPYPHIPDNPMSRGPQPFPKSMPRQILTSPGKLGSYGTPGLALSEIGNEYIATIYDQPRINAKKERDAWRRRMPAVPFIPVGRRGYTFDESPFTGVSTCYVMTKPFMPKPVQPSFKHFVVDKPWRPAGYVEDKPTAMDYREDPYNAFDPREDPKSRVKKPSDAVFRTGYRCDNFWYTQSIVFRRL